MNSITDLWREILLNQKTVWLRVTSGSMAPMIPIESQILVEPFHAAKRIRFGEIAVFSDGTKKLIVHRVLFTQLAKNRFLQCGDNAQAPSFVSIDNICGVVKKVTAYEKEFYFDSYPARLFNIFMGMTSVWILSIGRFWPKAGYFFRRLRCKIVAQMIRGFSLLSCLKTE